MATDQLEYSQLSRLESISEELRAIEAEIVANLETLQARRDLVAELIARCDRLALELDALALEREGTARGATDVEMESPDTSGDGSGLLP